MESEKKIFERKRPRVESFEQFGFKRQGDKFVYERSFMNGDFLAEIVADKDGAISGKVFDTAADDEYLPLKIEARDGAFVNTVRSEYESILLDIAANCYVDVPFCSDQANRIAELIFEKYADRPDFPWNDNTYDTSGVFRHPKTRKWYALIMDVKRKVFDKTSDADAVVDVINLKADCDKTDELHKIDGVYPAYHMNHKQWISVLLDDTLSDKQVMGYVETSHRLTDGKKKA